MYKLLDDKKSLLLIQKGLAFILGISSLSHAGNRTNQTGLNESTDKEKIMLSDPYREVDLTKEKQRINNNNHIRPSSAEVLID